MPIDDRKAELGKREYEGPDPQSSKGEKLYNSGDGSTDLAYQLLEGARTEEDIAAAMQSAPGYVRAIVLVAQKKFGNAVVQRALVLANSGDHTAGVTNREAMYSGAAHLTDVNAPAANGALPWTDKSWDALAINKALGQYDQIDGTDSDGARCTFAATLASHIFKGPAATTAWANAYARESQARQTTPQTPKQLAARNVIFRVTDAIDSKTATYGDLSWLQEGLHDLTVASDSAGAANSAFALTDAEYTDAEKHAVNKPCYTPAALIAEAQTLQPGEQFMCEWSFIRNGETEEREHQILVVNDGGKLYLYDSEIQGTGGHLKKLDLEGLKPYFPDKGSWIVVAYKLFVAPPGQAPAAPEKKH